MNTKILRRAALAAVLALGSLAAVAQAPDADRGQKRLADMQKRFDAADANHDGRLTKEEARKMPMVSRHFDEIDTAHSGSISMADIQAYAKARRAARQSATP